MAISYLLYFIGTATPISPFLPFLPNGTHRVGICHSAETTPGSSCCSLSIGIELAELGRLLRAESRPLFALELLPSGFPLLLGQVLLGFVLQQRVVLVVMIDPIFPTLELELMFVRSEFKAYCEVFRIKGALIAEDNFSLESPPPCLSSFHSRIFSAT